MFHRHDATSAKFAQRFMWTALTRGEAVAGVAS
jgi:hypothetical protein